MNIRSALTTFAAAAALNLLLTGCATAPQAEVRDFDTYQVISLGDANYVTPMGVRAVNSGRGFVEHQIDHLPGVSVRVSIDPNPPRDFKFDSDAATRQFLDELDTSFLRSAQYSKPVYRNGEEVRTQQWMKVFTEGQGSEGPISGVLLIVREQNETALIRLIGPRDKRFEMNQMVERIARAVVFEV